MLQEKVIVAVLLEAGVEGVAKGRHGIARRTVPVNRVLLEAIIGRKIEAAPEPPGGGIFDF